MSSDGKRKVGIVLHADSINMLRQRAGPTQNKARTRPGIEELDFAAMRACNLAHDRQADARAADTSLFQLGSANERFEYPFQIGRAPGRERVGQYFETLVGRGL